MVNRIAKTEALMACTQSNSVVSKEKPGMGICLIPDRISFRPRRTSRITTGRLIFYLELGAGGMTQFPAG